jgi:hypothetical protein
MARLLVGSLLDGGREMTDMIEGSLALIFLAISTLLVIEPGKRFVKTGDILAFCLFCLGVLLATVTLSWARYL